MSCKLYIAYLVFIVSIVFIAPIFNRVYCISSNIGFVALFVFVVYVE